MHIQHEFAQKNDFSLFQDSSNRIPYILDNQVSWTLNYLKSVGHESKIIIPHMFHEYVLLVYVLRIMNLCICWAYDFLKTVLLNLRILVSWNHISGETVLYWVCMIDFLSEYNSTDLSKKILRVECITGILK